MFDPTPDEAVFVVEMGESRSPRPSASTNQTLLYHQGRAERRRPRYNRCHSLPGDGAMATIRRLNGTRDLAPQEWRKLSIIQRRLETFLDRRGYEVVSTPVLESTDLFLRKSGGELAARMYSFTDPSGRRVSLRPEFTSSMVRAYVEGALDAQLPLRMQYSGSVFRYDRDESGPREFYQFGAELLGADSTAAGAESMAFAVQGLSALGVRGHRLRIGHLGVVNGMLEALRLSERARVFLLGSLASLRSAAADAGGKEQVRVRATELGLLRGDGRRDLSDLAQRLEAKDAREMVEGFLSEAVTTTIGQRNPEEVFMRYLRKLRDTEDPARIQQALEFASSLANISGQPKLVLPRLQSLLAEYGLPSTLLKPVQDLVRELEAYDLAGVPLVLDLGLARGIAYYTGFVFEVEHPKVNGTPSLGGGGRYDGLVKALGGSKDVPALGYAYAIDRVAELVPDDFGGDEPQPATRVLVVAAEATMQEAVATAERLRAQGIPAELDIVSKTEAAAARYAKRRGITTVMRVGRDGTTTEREL